MNFSLFNTDLNFILPGVIAAVLVIGLVIFVIIKWLKKANRISNRLDQFVGEEDQPESPLTPTRIVPREITGSLYSRTIINWFNSFLDIMGRYTPKKMALDAEHKLMIAGNPSNLHSRGFLAIRFLAIIAGIIIALFINRDLKNIDITYVLGGILSIVIGLALPVVWLNGQVRSRQDEIRTGLPDMLDMLSVCASAGLGFDQSLQKISKYWDTEMGHEIKRVTHEMEMGVARSTALKSMSKRLEVDDLTQFIAIIVQAEKIGMSYADVLHSQALQLRIMRQVRAREIANRLPGKIIIPVILFIFPAMLAVILGPAIPTIMNIF